MHISRWLQWEKGHLLFSADNDAISASNAEKVMEAQKTWKGGAYIHCNNDVRVKIAKYACQNRNEAEVTKLLVTLVTTVW